MTTATLSIIIVKHKNETLKPHHTKIPKHEIDEKVSLIWRVSIIFHLILISKIYIFTDFYTHIQNFIFKFYLNVVNCTCAWPFINGEGCR